MRSKLLPLLPLALLIGVGGTASADTEPYKAQGVFCDTLDATRDFMSAYKGGDPGDALKQTNAKHGEGNCGTALLFIKDLSKFDTITTFNGLWRFVEVQVVAQVHVQGPLMMIEPMHTPKHAFTAIMEEAKAEPSAAQCDTNQRNCI